MLLSWNKLQNGFACTLYFIEVIECPIGILLCRYSDNFAAASIVSIEQVSQTKPEIVAKLKPETGVVKPKQETGVANQNKRLE